MRIRNETGGQLDFSPIGKAMREARRSEGWTQAQVAEKLGIERAYYQRIETCKQTPSLDLFCDIVRLFQLSADEFIFPNIKPTRSGHRMRLDAMLDRLNDNDLFVIEGSVKGLLRAKESYRNP